MKARAIHFHTLLILTVAACSFIQIGCDGDNPAGVPRNNSQPVIEEIPDKAVDGGYRNDGGSQRHRFRC